MPPQQKNPHMPSATVTSSSSSSSSSRQRPDRPMAEPHFSAPHWTAGSTKAALPPLTRGLNDNPSQMTTIPPYPQQIPPHQQQRPSSHDASGSVPSSKNRNIINPQQMPVPDPQQRHKSEQQKRHSVKEQQQQQPQQKPIDPPKSSIKQLGMFPGNDMNPSKLSSNSSSSSNRPTGYQQPPNYNQAMASRNMQPDQQHASVHSQKHPQQQQQQSQSIPESSFRLTDDMNRSTMDHMEMNSPPKQQQKAPSIFSPEWNDKSNVMPSLVQPPQNLTSKINGMNARPNSDSPKKHERSGRSDTPKKDKHRSSADTVANSLKSSSEKRSNSTAKRYNDPISSIPNVNAVQPPAYDTTSMPSSKHNMNVSVKRPHLDDSIKQESIDFRDTKHRRMDGFSAQSPSRSMQPTVLYDNKSSTSLNGIETNPDLVSSLLKESLFNDSKYPSLNPGSIGVQPPQQLLQAPAVPQQPPPMSIKIEKADPQPIPMDITTSVMHLPPQLKLEPGDNDHELKIKSEKKKKKEKHKHKEKDKDKTKDREERKKHKKDKDRHKERSNDMAVTATQTADGHNPIKITIPRDKLNLPATGAAIDMPPSNLRITIPKDRIKTPPPTASLKIKISKDMLESYGGGGGAVAQYAGGGFDATAPIIPAINQSHHSAGGGGSSKKKDKDRERGEKSSKSSKSLDYSKHNGNGSNGSSSNGGPASGNSAQQANNSRGTSSNPNKVREFINNFHQIDASCDEFYNSSNGSSSSINSSTGFVFNASSNQRTNPNDSNSTLLYLNQLNELHDYYIANYNQDNEVDSLLECLKTKYTSNPTLSINHALSIQHVCNTFFSKSEESDPSVS